MSCASLLFGHASPRRDHRSRPTVVRLEARGLLTVFTMMSPVGLAPLLPQITAAGGIILDLIGANGGRIEAQLPPDRMFQGTLGAAGTVTLGTQSGLTPTVLRSLGGGLSGLAVRLTMSQGGSGPGEPGRNAEFLSLNGIELGGFSAVVTEQTSPDGLASLSLNTAGGFRSNSLDTGFFSSSDPDLLTRIYESIAHSGVVSYAMRNDSSSSQTLDFTAGLAPDLAHGPRSLVFAIEPPLILSASADSPIDEGSSSLLTVTARIPHQNPNQPPNLTYQFDVLGDGSYAISNTTGSLSQTFNQPGTNTIPFRVVRPQGSFALGQATVEVRNVAPMLVSPGGQSALEGTPASIDLGRFSDPGADGPWSVLVDWGDGTAVGEFQASQTGSLGSLPHTYVQDGSYTVTIHVTDRFGAGGDESFQVGVENVAPSIESLTATSPGSPDEASLLSLVFTDPGKLDTFELTIDWGDHSVTTAPLGAGIRSFSTSHLYASGSGTYAVTIRIKDDGGGQATALTSVTVASEPVPPQPPEPPAPPEIRRLPQLPPGSAPTAVPITPLDFFKPAAGQTASAWSSFVPKLGLTLKAQPLGQDVKPGPDLDLSGDEPPKPPGRSLEELLELLKARPAVSSARRSPPVSSASSTAAAAMGANAAVQEAGGAANTGALAVAAVGKPRQDAPPEEPQGPKGKATRIMMLVVWTLSLKHQRRRTRTSRRSARGSGSKHQTNQQV